MKKYQLLVAPLLAVSFLASCGGGGDAPTGPFTIETQCSYCYFDSIQESYKGGSDVNLTLRLYDGEYTLPSNPEIYFGEKLAEKGTDYTYVVNGLTANLKFKIKSDVKIIASVDELSEPLTFTATTENSSLSLYLSCWDESLDIDLDLESKVNDGMWKKVTIPEKNDKSLIADNLYPNDTVQLRGNNEFWSSEDDINDRLFMFTTGKNDRFTVSGNIMSLLDKEKFVNKKDVSPHEFEYLFAIESEGADGYCQITDASKLCLPATKLSANCYESMFAWTLIEKAPYLPALTLADYCYYAMFLNCENLTIAPKLLATEIAPCAYDSIFQFCTGLTKVEVSFIATSDQDWPNDEGYPYTYSWLGSVPKVGTFIWPGETNHDTLEAAGLLSERTEEDYEEINYIPDGWTVTNN